MPIINSHDSTPVAKGTAPMEAFIVAFGVYVIMQTNFSFQLKSVPVTEIKTLTELDTNPTAMINNLFYIILNYIKYYKVI